MGEQVGRPANLARARQEYEHVAVIGRYRPPNGRRDGLLCPLLDAAAEIARLHRECPTLARHDRGVAEQSRDARAVECCGHHEDPQIGPQDVPPVERQGKREISVETPLVELIEDDEPDAIERRITLHHACEDPLGDDLDPGGATDAGLSPHAKTHGIPDTLAPQLRHSAGGGPGREPPGLEHEDPLSAEPRRVEERGRHSGGLPRPGRRLQHGTPRVT